MAIPNLNLGASEKVSRILGSGYQGPAAQRAYRTTGANAAFVARKIEQLLARLQEVEKASGTVIVKIVEQPAKKVNFHYG